MQTVTKIVHDRVTSSNPQTMYIHCGGAVSTIAQNKDASQVVVGGRNVFKIYSVDDDCFEEKYNLRVGKHVNLNYCASDIAWNNTDDHILATGATNGAVVIWDLSRTSRSKQEHIFQEHKRTVNRVCFHENEHKLLLSASQDGSMKLFDLRKKEVSLNFSIGSTSVRDIMFSPCNLNYFGFASADESGNLMIWDMRRPDRCEKQFPAHSGPVFSVNWHPEDKNWFATAGRDKMIKVWDLSKQKCMYTIYSIASVARIKWRPQRRFHIASCSLLVDCSINIWDIRRPYVPFATFDNHKDVTTSMVFKNKDPHVMLSGSKDSFLYQHVFRDAKRPGEELVPAGLDLSVYGTVGHANSDKQGKLSSISEGGGIMSSLLTKKSTERNDHFVDVTAYVQVFSETGQVVPIEELSWMVESARNYKLTGLSVEELCKHNSKVAQSLHRGQVAQAWMLVLTLYCTHIVENKNLHVNRTSSVMSSGLTEKIDIDKNKLAKEPDTDVDDKNMDGTSGNSDEEIDDKEMFDSKLSNIARGQINPDWDIFFGDGEPGSFDMTEINDFSDSKQEWILPSEAFHPRHEIHDRETPLENFQNGGKETQIGPTLESEVANNVVTKGSDDKCTNNVLTANMQLLQNPDWKFVTVVTDMLKNLAAEGDVQTPVCMLIVLKDRIRKFIEPDLQEDWFFSYIVTSSNPQTMFIHCGGAVSTIAQNKDASQVVVGGRNGKHVNLNYCASDIAWNNTDEHIFQEHKRTVNRVCFHENEHKLLLSASQDGSMKLFDLRKKEVSLSFSIGSTSVRDIMFSPCNLSYFGFASADESGNLMRGKRVPVLIPDDTKEALKYITDTEVRRIGGVKKTNGYMFATKGDGVIKASECIRELGNENAGELIHPDRLTSTGYRAYMATIAQCLGLKDHQIQWLCRHLGHTMDVHQTHYRFTLDGIERIQLGKLLMLQDKNLLSRYKDTDLADIEFEEIVASGRKQPQGEDEQPEADETEHVIDDVEMEMGEIDEPESLAMAPAKHQKKSKVMRVRWMEAETSELLKYAHEYLEKRKTPSRNVCKSFIASSKAAGGELHKRSADNILKKISAMNVKARKTDE